MHCEGLPATVQTKDCLHPKQRWHLAVVRPPNLPRRPLLLGCDCCRAEEGHCLALTVSSAVDVPWKRLTGCASGHLLSDFGRGPLTICTQPSSTGAFDRPFGCCWWVLVVGVGWVLLVGVGGCGCGCGWLWVWVVVGVLDMGIQRCV